MGRWGSREILWLRVNGYVIRIAYAVSQINGNVTGKNGSAIRKNYTVS